MALLKDHFKVLLTKFGYYSSEGMTEALDGVANYLEVGRWMRARGFDVPRRVECRERVFDRMSADISESRVLYLEFGVYRGASMIYWSKLLRSPSARLHGFDSFEGLPEIWHFAPIGAFSTGGVCRSLMTRESLSSKAGSKKSSRAIPCPITTNLSLMWMPIFIHPPLLS